jgi:hypothetical protein
MEYFKGQTTHKIYIFHQVLLWMDGCDELEDDNAKTVDVTLHCELVCWYVDWVYVAICAFKAKIVAIKDLFFGQPKIRNL